MDRIRIRQGGILTLISIPLIERLLKKGYNTLASLFYKTKPKEHYILKLFKQYDINLVDYTKDISQAEANNLLLKDYNKIKGSSKDILKEPEKIMALFVLSVYAKKNTKTNFKNFMVNDNLWKHRGKRKKPVSYHDNFRKIKNILASSKSKYEFKVKDLKQFYNNFIDAYKDNLNNNDKQEQEQEIDNNIQEDEIQEQFEKPEETPQETQDNEQDEDTMEKLKQRQKGANNTNGKVIKTIDQLIVLFYDLGISFPYKTNLNENARAEEFYDDFFRLRSIFLKNNAGNPLNYEQMVVLTLFLKMTALGGNKQTVVPSQRIIDIMSEFNLTKNELDAIDDAFKKLNFFQEELETNRLKSNGIILGAISLTTYFMYYVYTNVGRWYQNNIINALYDIKTRGDPFDPENKAPPIAQRVGQENRAGVRQTDRRILIDMITFNPILYLQVSLLAGTALLSSVLTYKGLGWWYSQNQTLNTKLDLSSDKLVQSISLQKFRFEDLLNIAKTYKINFNEKIVTKAELIDLIKNYEKENRVFRDEIDEIEVQNENQEQVNNVTQDKVNDDIENVKPPKQQNNVSFNMQRLNNNEIINQIYKSSNLNDNIIDKKKKITDMNRDELEKIINPELQTNDNVSYDLFDLWLKNKQKKLDNLERADTGLSQFSDRNYKKLKFFETKSKNLLLSQIENLYYQVYLDNLKYTENNDKMRLKEMRRQAQLKQKDDNNQTQNLKDYQKPKQTYVQFNPFQTWHRNYTPKNFDQRDPFENDSKRLNMF